MPELPEVETTRRGLAPFLVGARVQSVVVRDRRLRWPVPSELETAMEAQIITAVHRRAKYLLWQTQAGTCLVHLGMSGSLRLVKHTDELHTHDHVIWRLPKGQEVRLRDPRRFGAVLWVEGDPADHKLLRHLGPEPLGNGFHADWLYRRSRGRRIAIKSFIMGAAEVVGVGNIYASESLFRAGIHPTIRAGRVSKARYEALVSAIRAVLTQAIEAGGTTLRDFVRNDGEPGYFAQALAVYGRAGEPCPRCRKPISRRVIGQRSTFYCTACQR